MKDHLRTTCRLNGGAWSLVALVALFVLAIGWLLGACVNAAEAEGGDLSGCVKVVPCDAECTLPPNPPVVAYETKDKALAGGVLTVADEYQSATVVLEEMRRLAVDAPGGRALAVFGVNGLPALGAIPLHGETRFGKIDGILGRGMFVAVEAGVGETPTAPPAGGRVFTCYGVDLVQPGRFTIDWSDRFGDHTGSFGRVTYACFPANGTDSEPFVCYGQSRDVGQAPAPVHVETSLGSLGRVSMKPADEFCTPLR